MHITPDYRLKKLIVIGDRLFVAFRNYAAGDHENGLTVANITSQAEYVRTRLREELATANYSSEAGVQVLLETDPQVLKAIEVMPQASEVALLARKNGFIN